MSSNSPCAACKCLRRKCTQECVFAPYFPPDQPKKFEVVHKVFGASNVTKLLNELHTTQREDAVNSLAYEAEARLRDPIYGCLSHISLLQGRLKQSQAELVSAKKELAAYIGPQAMMALVPSGLIMPHQQEPMIGVPYHGGNGMVIREAPQQQPLQPHHAGHHQQQQQQIYEAHELAAAAEEAAREQEIEMLRSLEVQRQQRHGEDQEMLRFNGGGFVDGGNHASNMVTATGFNQIVTEDETSIPSLGIGLFDDVSQYHHQQQPMAAEPLQVLQAQLLLQPEQDQLQVLEHHQHQSPEETTEQPHEQPPQQSVGSEELETGSIAGAPIL